MFLSRLFGNEDTDLRQLPGVSPGKNKERPPTPPPPIISNDSRLDDATEIKFKKESPKARNFDEIRAKLANATGKSAKLSSGKFYIKFSRKPHVIFLSKNFR